MEIGALKETYRVKLPQPSNQVIPPLAMRLLALGPSSSGKTNALVTMITDARFYGKNVWERIYWVSPTASVDPSLDQLRDYVRNEMPQQDQVEDPTFHDGLGDDTIQFLEERVAKARKVMEFLKARKAKQKGFNTLIVLDDLADVRARPRLQKFVDAAFVKYRHWGISIVLSTQKLKLPLISPTCRVNLTCLMCWRLRNQTDLWEGLIYELSALISKEKLLAAYDACMQIPYNFLYVNLLAKDVDNMFYSGFTQKFVMSE